MSVDPVTSIGTAHSPASRHHQRARVSQFDLQAEHRPPEPCCACSQWSLDRRPCSERLQARIASLCRRGRANNCGERGSNDVRRRSASRFRVASHGPSAAEMSTLGTTTSSNSCHTESIPGAHCINAGCQSCGVPQELAIEVGEPMAGGRGFDVLGAPAPLQLSATHTGSSWIALDVVRGASAESICCVRRTVTSVSITPQFPLRRYEVTAAWATMKLRFKTSRRMSGGWSAIPELCDESGVADSEHALEVSGHA